MTTKIALTKARINLGALVKRVALKKERFVLEKDGYPVAMLVDVDEYEDYLDTQDKELKRDIAESVADFKAGRFYPVDKLLKELKQTKTGRPGNTTKLRSKK